MNIINLTQHIATQDQEDEGVFEPENKQVVQDLITFTSLPTKEDMIDRAKKLAEIALQSKANFAMVGAQLILFQHWKMSFEPLVLSLFTHLHNV